MTSEANRRSLIEPFDPDKHDRTAFSCGTQAVDNFFKKTANKLSKANNLRVFVMMSSEADLIGFYALNAHSVDYRDLPPKYTRTRPNHGQIPGVYISMMGVDERHVGKGFAGDLLIDALIRIARTAEDLGIAVVMLDVLDCGNPDLVQKRLKLYRRHGFTPLVSDPLRMFLPVGTVLALVGQQNEGGA